MASGRIVVLGAGGNTGRHLARLLIARTRAHVVLTARVPERLRELFGELEALGAADRIELARADATDTPSLREAFAGATVVVNAASTAPYTAALARACLDAGADWIDIVLAASRLAALRAMERDITAARRRFVTDGGFHPGLPALLVRAVAPEFDTLERAVVQSVIALDWRTLAFAPSTVEEFLEEIARTDLRYFKDGRWLTAAGLRPSDFPRMEFGPPFGRRYGAPMLLEEMRVLPERIPTLRETGFFVGGFSPLVDWVILPAATAAMRVAPRRSRRPAAAALLWGLRACSRPPFGTLLRLEASGTRAGAPHRVTLTVSHPDGYEFTALPVVACVEQLLDGTLAAPGLHLQAWAADPVRTLDALRAMGATVERTSG